MLKLHIEEQNSKQAKQNRSRSEEERLASWRAGTAIMKGGGAGRFLLVSGQQCGGRRCKCGMRDAAAQWRVVMGKFSAYMQPLVAVEGAQ